GDNVHWIALGEQQTQLPAVPGELFAASPKHLALVAERQLTLWDVASAKALAKTKLPKDLASALDRLTLLDDRLVLATKGGGLWELPFDADRWGKLQELPQRHRQRIRQLLSIPGGLISSDARHRVIWQRRGETLQALRDEPDGSGEAIQLNARR